MKFQLIFRARIWFWAALAATVPSAHAFPPAPNHVIYGLIRDEYGDPLTQTNAQVILETSSGITIANNVVPNLSAGVNYKITVPMDAGLTSDAYKPTALKPTVPFRIKVLIGTITYLPIQMAGDYSHLGQPAQKTRIDLYLGVDSIGDGIPDAWKQMVVSMSGGLYTNISQITPGGRYPGNRMTFMQSYIAGTYPWDLDEGFSLEIVQFTNGAPVMQFLAIQGRAYTIQGSVDLTQWTTVPFQNTADGAQAPLLNTYQASDVRTMQITVPGQAGVTNHFFKAMVE